MTTQEVNAIFDKFLLDNNGKFIERVDPNAYAQCFDLAIYWCEYLGFPKTIFSGLTKAEQIYTQWTHPQFDKLPNTTTFIPIKGDIVVWGGGLNGGIGHVAVATGVGDISLFQSFDQNWVVGSPSKLVSHNYNYVLGVQRLKVTTQPDPMNPAITKKASFFDRVWHAYKGDNVNTDIVSDQDVTDYINYVKSNVNRAGKWNEIALKAGFTTDSNTLIVDQVFNTIKAMGSNTAADRKKAINDCIEALKKVV